MIYMLCTIPYMWYTGNFSLPSRYFIRKGNINTYKCIDQKVNKYIIRSVTKTGVVSSLDRPFRLTKPEHCCCA